MHIYGNCAELAERNVDTDQILGIIMDDENNQDEFAYNHPVDNSSFGEECSGMDFPFREHYQFDTKGGWGNVKGQLYITV